MVHAAYFFRPCVDDFVSKLRIAALFHPRNDTLSCDGVSNPQTPGEDNGQNGAKTQYYGYHFAMSVIFEGNFLVVAGKHMGPDRNIVVDIVVQLPLGNGRHY